MDLILWWMPIAWLVVVGIVVLVVTALRRRSTSRQPDGRAVAHSDRLTALPAYRRALRRYRALLGVLAAASVALLLSGIALSSRPAVAALVSPDLGNRDIVLCLDVSGSMVDFDAELVSVFRDLVTRFDGERISLVVFNASAVTYFPLTNDYGYVDAEFERITEEFGSDDASYFDGTFVGNGSSLVGDGLAACALRFDTPDADRSRSVILATDNLVVGQPIFTLPEAGDLAAGRDVRVYGINPGDTDAREYLAPLATEFAQVAVGTGGAYYALDDPRAISDIVRRIGSEQLAATPGVPVVVRRDAPALPFGVAFAGLTALVALAWRLKR